MKNSFLISFFLIVLCIFGFFAFDFGPRVHKEILKAQSAISHQNYKKAIALYEKILKRNPDRELKIKILYQLGDIYSIYISQNEKAVKYYKKVISLTDDPLWVTRTKERIADIYFSYIKNYEEALKTYDKLKKLKLGIKRENFYEFRYAQSLFKLNRLEQAAEEFKKIEKNSDHKHYIPSIYFLGLINFQKKKWRRAISYWKNYIQIETRSAQLVQVKFLMANAYETMEELKKAYNVYYSILGEYPNVEVIQNRLNSIYSRRVARKR